MVSTMHPLNTVSDQMQYFFYKKLSTCIYNRDTTAQVAHLSGEGLRIKTVNLIGLSKQPKLCTEW